MTDKTMGQPMAETASGRPRRAGRDVVRAVPGRGGAAARRRPRRRSVRRRRPPSCWRRTGRTRWPQRSRRPGGGCSSPSTSPTCRSSWSAAAVASILIGQIATGIAVLLITALNALGGLRQQGKAESAMNALQSMLKTSCPGPP